MELSDLLNSIGFTDSELCHFLASILECETDMLHTTFRLQMNLNICSSCKLTGSRNFQMNLFHDVQKKIYCTLVDWQVKIHNLRILRSELSLKNECINPLKLNKSHKYKNNYSLLTDKVKYLENDDISTSNSLITNHLRIHTNGGYEVYLPTINCSVPFFDFNFFNCIEKLEIQLLINWYDLVKSQYIYIKQSFLFRFMDCFVEQMDLIDLTINCDIWLNLKRNIKLFLFNQDKIGQAKFNIKEFVRNLTKVENALRRNNSINDYEVLLNLIVQFHKTLLYFMAIKEKLCIYKQNLLKLNQAVRVMDLNADSLELLINKPIRDIQHIYNRKNIGITVEL